MTGNIFLQAVSGARRLTPLVASLLFAILGGLPFYLPGFAIVAPGLALVAVYYWAVQRPDLLPAPAVFAIGLFVDAVSGLPLGVNALLLLLVHTVVVGQRRVFYGKSFLVVWWGFAMVAAVSTALAWLLLVALEGRLIAPVPALFQLGVTVAVYPLASWALALLQRRVLGGA